ncbi:MAG TPA: peptidoglycan-binding domain-containing protein [Actinophytocola sp.]|uniref:peptidoglycan-binding domain-containing protein n=1 Tax=Actinophytocola sp. TaxID=1872138 RepID=UPI002DB9B76E|nr:peptidoglycan-binding domain-containing protein [Actinophytocola sp.]HEU5476111.1 peptidoglycan-binding domain-containing protein [Actinophytocola sp.]
MADEPVLEKNQSGEWVQYLQQLLQHAGYWSGATNGEFDDALEEAVKQFQSAYGLPADGIVGAGTWAALTGGGAQSSTGTGEQSSQDPNERQVLINGADIPELMYLLSFDSFEDWGRAIGLDLEWLQSDDDQLVS